MLEADNAAARRCGCSGRATGWSGTSPTAPTPRPTTGSTLGGAAAPLAGPLAAAAGRRLAGAGAVARPPARARWSPSRSRSSCAPWSRPRAAAASTAAPATAPHAAGVLVERHPAPAAEALRLPRGTADETLVAAVAARTGRDPREVHDLLRPTRPAPKDAQLVELGQRLLELEDEVRTP